MNIVEEGYLFVYLSYDNDSPNWVYFDDLKITHTKTNVIQYNDYYPFGLLASTSWTRDDNKNNHLYNAGSELNRTSGWYETALRGYDPAIGRFMQIDMMASAYASYSGYHYALNNPVSFNDPTGAYAEAVDARSIIDDLNGWFNHWGFQGGGARGYIAYCSNCPNTPEFLPYINDPDNVYDYDPETGTVSLFYTCRPLPVICHIDQKQGFNQR